MCLVVVDLQPFSIVSHSGMRKMLDSWKPGVGGQEEVKQAFDHIVTTCMQTGERGYRQPRVPGLARHDDRRCMENCGTCAPHLSCIACALR